jgi:hypothetical protein
MPKLQRTRNPLYLLKKMVSAVAQGVSQLDDPILGESAFQKVVTSLAQGVSHFSKDVPYFRAV